MKIRHPMSRLHGLLSRVMRLLGARAGPVLFWVPHPAAASDLLVVRVGEGERRITDLVDTVGPL